jgi:hypothetical protein
VIQLPTAVIADLTASMPMLAAMAASSALTHP